MSEILRVLGYNANGNPKLLVRCAGCGREYVTDGTKRRVLAQRWCYACHRYEYRCRGWSVPCHLHLVLRTQPRVSARCTGGAR